MKEPHRGGACAAAFALYTVGEDARAAAAHSSRLAGSIGQMNRFKAWIWTALAAASVAGAVVSVNAQEQRAPWPSERFNPAPQRNTAGEFDYYALVLSWSPTYCSGAGEDDDQQCNRRDGKRYSFVLHGLWPQYEKGYPESCRIARRPYVPQPLIDSMLDIMPSSRLVIHEYRKHGTCSGLTPDGYYALSRRLYSSVRIPQRFQNPFDTQQASPSEVISEFRRVNPQITPDMMAVSCGGPGNKLREIRICFSREGQPRSCGDNENQRRMCSASSMFIPPSRSTARTDEFGSDTKSQSGTGDNTRPFPRPRVIESLRGI